MPWWVYTSYFFQIQQLVSIVSGTNYFLPKAIPCQLFGGGVSPQFFPGVSVKTENHFRSKIWFYLSQTLSIFWGVGSDFNFFQDLVSRQKIIFTSKISFYLRQTPFNSFLWWWVASDLQLFLGLSVKT